MALKYIGAFEVSCQLCDATILLKKWQDAREHGWAVPCDGLLQLCPRCVIFRKGVLSATAIPIGSLADKLPGEA